MTDFAGFDEEPIEDKLPEPPEDENPTKLPSKANRHEEACFPSNDYGMPLALNSIPARERSFFWKDGKYRKMPIAYVPVQAPEHEYLFKQVRKGRKLNRAFYVHSPEGTIGLVPHPTSTVVWPWEAAAWAQDLAPENQGKARPAPGEHFGPDPKDSQRKEYK